MAEEPVPPPNPWPDIEVRPAWRRDDPEIEADAIDFWTRLKLLPAEVAPEQRAKELIAAAYRDGRLIAVSTAAIQWVPFLHARFAIIRGATDPEHRRSHAQLALAIPSRNLLERWALDHPEEKLAGGLAVIDSPDWGDFLKLPVWPYSELGLVGYTSEGHQIRAAWFDHFRLD